MIIMMIMMIITRVDMCVSFGLSAQVCYSSLSVWLFVCPVSLSLCLSLHFASQCTSVVHSRLPLSLSLCLSVALSISAFCFATCVVRHSLASSLAKSMRKSTRKSIRNRSREGSWGTQNRVKIAPGTLSGGLVAPKSVPKASRERRRSVSGRPRGDPRAPGGFPRAPRDAKKTGQERPGARRGDRNRR